MPDIEKTLKWMEDRKGKVTYSQVYRLGTASYDCSSAVYFALWAGGFTTRINYAGNTENLFKEKGYLTTEIRFEDIRRGDMFISGVEGGSGGDAGHTGFVWDKDHIIHCNYPDNGINITPISGRTGSPTRWFRLKGSNPSVPPVKWDIDNYTDEEIARKIYSQEWALNGDERIEVLGDRWRNVQDIINAINNGTWDNSDVGDVVLEYNGATLTSDVLEKILANCKTYDILPSYAITILHYEGLWGSSQVGKVDNNWGGMTWTGNPRPSGVKVTKGMARPASETGYYMHYDSVDDFLKDWFYLLRDGGIYKVSGKKDFDSAVKGMFKTGGATYDYAALGYTDYLANSKARKESIEAVNGELERFDQQMAVWEHDSNGWWYSNGGDYPVDEWELIGDHWYRFDSNGYAMENQWYQDGNSNWYYFKDGGYMAVDEMVKIGDKQYYFDKDGILQTETKVY